MTWSRTLLLASDWSDAAVAFNYKMSGTEFSRTVNADVACIVWYLVEHPTLYFGHERDLGLQTSLDRAKGTREQGMADPAIAWGALSRACMREMSGASAAINVEKLAKPILPDTKVKLMVAVCLEQEQSPSAAWHALLMVPEARGNMNEECYAAGRLSFLQASHHHQFHLCVWKDWLCLLFSISCKG